MYNFANCSLIDSLIDFRQIHSEIHRLPKSVKIVLVITFLPEKLADIHELVVLKRKYDDFVNFD